MTTSYKRPEPHYDPNGCLNIGAPPGDIKYMLEKQKPPSGSDAISDRTLELLRLIMILFLAMASSDTPMLMEYVVEPLRTDI